MPTNEEIENIYINNEFPIEKKLLDLVKIEFADIKKVDITNFLKLFKQTQEIVQKNIKHKNSGHIIARRPNENWQMDILKLDKFYKTNNNYKVLLLIVDIYPLKAFARALKDETAESCVNALNDIIEKNKIQPRIISTDNASNFLSFEFQKYLDSKKIILVKNILNDHHSMGIIDNFCRRFRQWMINKFAVTKKLEWYPGLDGFIKNYNESDHSSILDLKPNEVVKDIKNIERLDIQNIELALDNKVDLSSDLEPGDRVKIKMNLQFTKKSERHLSKKIYTVISAKGKRVKLEDHKDELRTSLIKIIQNPINAADDNEDDDDNDAEPEQPYLNPVAQLDPLQVLNKELRLERRLRKENIRQDVIINEKRVRKPNIRYV